MAMINATSKSQIMDNVNDDKRKQKLKNSLTVLLFILPALLIYLVFILYPIVKSFNYSLYDWNGIDSNKIFIGLKNFYTMFSSSAFWYALRNNFYIIIASVFFQIPLGLIMALIISSKIKGKKFLNVVYFLPYLMSTVAIGLLWTFLYDPVNGPVNKLLNMFGIESIHWLADKNTAVIAVLIVMVWQFAPFYMILIRAAMVGIPDELYEAASIDGANGVQQFFYITLPSLMPTFINSSILAIVGSLKTFDLFFIMTGGGTNINTEILGTYMYKQTFIHFKMGYGSAIAFTMFLVALVMTFIILALDQKRRKRSES